MPGFEETESEIRYRIRVPEGFDEFRRKEITDGVSIIYGRKNSSDEWAVQALWFDKSKFTLEQAKEWAQDHPDIGKSLVERASENPFSKAYRWKGAIKIEKAEGDLASEHFYIYGDASVEMVDGEGDIITMEALAYGLPQLLRRARISFAIPGMGHTDILVGEIIDEVTIRGTTYRTAIEGNSLKFVGDVWKDSHACMEVRQGILDGRYNSLSISGEALSREQWCDNNGCYTTIRQMDLSAVAICEEGMNPAAKFTLLKAEGSDIPVPCEKETTKEGKTTSEEKEKVEAPAKTSEPMITVEIKADEALKVIEDAKKGIIAEKEKLTQKPPVPADDLGPIPEGQGAEENPTEPNDSEVKAVIQALAAKLAECDQRIAALEQAQAKVASKPEDIPKDQEKAKEPAADTAKAVEEKKTEMPADVPKKTLAKDAGGSQMEPSKGGNWEDVGRRVKKAGGLNRL
jgi:hypothetical protein